LCIGPALLYEICGSSIITVSEWVSVIGPNHSTDQHNKNGYCDQTEDTTHKSNPHTVVSFVLSVWTNTNEKDNRRF